MEDNDNQNQDKLSVNEIVYNETTFNENNQGRLLINQTELENNLVNRNNGLGWLKHRHGKTTFRYGRKRNKDKEFSDHTIKMDQLNCFQYVFFTWMTPLIKRIFRHKLNIEDLGKCSPYEICHLNSSRLTEIWNQECNKLGLHNASLIKTMFSFVRKRFFVASLFYLLCLATGYLSSTFFVKKLLEELENILVIGEINVETTDVITNKTEIVNHGTQTITNAFKWVLLLYVCECARAISFSVMFAISIRTGMRCVNALNGIIYQKILTRNQHYISNNNSTIEPNNLFSNDVWKVFQMIYMLPLMIGSPIIIIVTIIYTYLLIGTSSFCGIILFLVIFLLQFSIIKRQTILRKDITQQTDYRISLVNQLVKFVRTIKFNAWEVPFQNEIQYCRLAECAIIKKYQYLQCLSTSLALLAPMLITIINILVYTWFHNDLKTSTAFSLLMLNYIAAHGVRSLPNYFREIVNGRIALNRIERLLQMDDHKSYINTEMIDQQNAIEIIDCSFFLSNDRNQNSKNSLTDITLFVKKKDHICLYGPVGSGKTAFLLSIMDQTQCSKGEVRLFSKNIAYVSQNVWLQNSSLKDNILFGLPLDNKRYYETLIKCSLVEDISMMENNDETIIGENGIKLSGGQKQRIALARAVYADSDIYLIDDCFSSLDSRVLKNVFNNVIKRILKHKTVIFVTRHLYLLDSDVLVAMFNYGKIENIEKHSKLLEESEEYRNLVEKSKVINEHDNDNSHASDSAYDEDFDQSDNELITNLIKSNQMNGDNATTNKTNNSYNSLISLMEQIENDNNNNEDIESNNEDIKMLPKSSKKSKGKKFHKKSISWSVYVKYIQSSGGWLLFSFMIAVFVLQMATSTFSNWWLSYWLNQGAGEYNTTLVTKNEYSILANPNIKFYQLIYLILFMIVIGTSLLMAVFFVRVITNAANTLHGDILSKLVHAPIIFFDSIKVGKIINLFSHNMDELDNQLPVAIDGFLQRVLLVMGNFIIIIIMLWWFTLPLIIFGLTFYFVFRYYRKAIYWLKQADMKLRSPIYSFVNSTMNGLNTIKAFQKEPDFRNNFFQLCDEQIAANYYYHGAVRWLSIRIDFICIMASLLITIMVIFNLKNVGSAYAGLLITQSLQLSGLLQLVIRLSLELETRLVSVERINTYTSLIKKEKSVLENLSTPELNEWPNEKRISFRNVSLRYRSNSPIVLDSVSFDIKGGQKFAIIGRTGAGKSSITYALFRLVEICSGKIYIDNIDIQSIPLRILRSKLSIIPQDSAIFQKSLRKNLDPFLKYKDDDLMEVLDQVKLRHKIELFKNGLDELVDEEIFSKGEKQLLCMARALLRKSKIIVLDEATSSVDNQTESDIWDIVTNNFNDCTIILIAHRLETVLKCDQLIVIEDGKTIEQGNPIELKNNPESYFFKMITKA